jgi:asparagine N-glycosylation enzyme membrane subunit Stt3
VNRSGAAAPATFFAILLIAVVALLARSLHFPVVFLGDGEVLMAIRDASIHARRALFSFVNFPAVLYWDPYLAYPTGAPVPMPPLYDWTLAAVARAFGDSLSAFEHVAAWSSPVLAALTVLPVYAGGRVVGGRGVGLGAAAIFALLPVSVIRSRVGEGYQDEEDVRYLLRNLNIQRYEDAEEILGRDYPLEEFPESAHIALRELLPDR